MERLEPTRQLAVKIWWSFIWRAVLLAVAAGFTVGVVFGILSMILSVDPKALNGVSGLLGLGVGAAVSIEVMFRILKKKFNGFEIALIRTEDSDF